ncbi:unnamed protein product [Triticum turgidum subsp. durum]|uniref:[RNA-polymerase]-subunit kinase n=1 Tax=Triticum turgidum subsp. durum TaxID=4567 RepID=A0A9R0VAN1_TRITD|nr:unnamed protein product [Triticum turgidum subsp. durum]
MASGGGDDAGEKRVTDRYLKREVLGEGTYGVVFKAIDTKTGETVAIKRIRLGKYKEGVNFTALREIKLLKELKDPNIIELIDAFPYKGNLHLVFEFMETDLEAVIRDRNIVLSPADIKSYIQMMLKGLAFCHKKWVLHRDMKPNNLLIGAEGQLKLGDFGLARIFGSPERNFTHQVFARWYRAPELLFGTKQYGSAVDVWAAGCIFAELLLRRPFLQVLVTLINSGRSLRHLEPQSLLNGQTWFAFQITLNTSLSLLPLFVRCFQWPVMMLWTFCQECLHMTQKQESLLSRL